jgi:oxygen-dependent protoporphyrinogen oxidase
VRRSVETLVVGGGISGLAYAHARGPAADLVLLEAGERAGGLIATESAEGVSFELGPEALRREPGGALAELFAELDLAEESPPPRASNRFLVHRGRLVAAPLGPRALLASPLLGWRGKLRLLSEPLRSRERALDGSVADFARHRLGSEALAALIDPLVSGIHAGDPEQLSMRACFPRLVELVQRHGSLVRALAATGRGPAPSLVKPARGCQALTDALARTLGSRLVLAAPVHALERVHERWLVESAAGSFECAHLVLALPAAEAARLLRGVAPGLALHIGEIQSESLASVVHVRRRADVGHALDGFGYLVPAREGLGHLGTLFSSSLAPSFAPHELVVLRTLVGGARHAELVELDDEHLSAHVEREVKPLLRLTGGPLHVSVRRWRAALPRYDLAHPTRLLAIEQATPAGLTLLGNWLDGIGVNHLIAAARARARAAAACGETASPAR